MLKAFHLSTFKHHPALIIRYIGAAFGLFFLLALLAFLLLPPKPSAKISSATSDGYATLLSDIKVNFTTPIARETLRVEMSPEANGEWIWADPIIGSKLYRSAVFQPNQPFQPTTTYQINVDGVKGISKITPEKSHQLSFTTQPLPKVVTVDTKESEQPINSGIVVEFDYPTNNAVEHNFILEPFVQVEVALSGDGRTVTLKPQEKLRQGQRYTLKVTQEIVDYDTDTGSATRRTEPVEIHSANFTTAVPLGITRVAPQGADILPEQSKLEVEFSQAPNKDEILKYLELTPPVEGEWQWVNDSTISYNFSKTLPLRASYKLKILPGLPGDDGRFFEAGGEFSFSTVGNLDVRSVSPRNGGYGIGQSSQIIIYFNQPANRPSVESAISISPTLQYQLQWSNNQTLKIVPTTALDHSTRYSIILGTSAQSVYSLPLSRTLNSAFTTVEKVTMLNVALDLQDRPLSCELAALKMALSYKGVSVGEDTLLALVGYNPRPRNGSEWDDPDVMFVGDVSGSQNTTGYGVHWDPIARAAKAYRNARAFSGWSLSDIAREIEAGNPVVVWGTQGTAYYDPWVTSGGKTIAAWKGEHARTAIGFKGRVDNPTAIILNDPISGRLTWTAAQFDSNWARMNRSGVVVN